MMKEGRKEGRKKEGERKWRKMKDEDIKEGRKEGR